MVFGVWCLAFGVWYLVFGIDLSWGDHRFDANYQHTAHPIKFFVLCVTGKSGLYLVSNRETRPPPPCQVSFFFFVTLKPI